ncbi:hypothetical protein BGZ94_005375, partial [Podila epigama]
LIALAAAQAFADALSQGLTSAALILLVSWVTALFLNKDEHAYTVRSSDFLCIHFFFAIFTSLFSLYIINDRSLSSDDDVQTLSALAAHITAYRILSIYTGLITAAFAVEVFPRGRTQVQETAREKEHLSNYQIANFFSRITFHYVSRIISLGASRPLSAADIEDTTLPHLKTKVNHRLVEVSWERAKVRGTPFYFALLRAFWVKIVLTMTLRVMGFGVSYIPTVMFGQLLKFFRDYSDATHEGTAPPPLKVGLLIAFGMLVANVTASLMAATALQNITEVSLRARAATVALIYGKALKLSPAARSKSTLGEITNHMAVDAEKMISASQFLPFVITIPFEITLAMYMLYQLLGWSFCAGLIAFGLMSPVQANMSKFLNGFQEARLEHMDSRIRLLTEILSNIKIVKLYGWEDAFRQKVDALRAKEIHALRGLSIIRALLTIVFSSVTLIMALATFSVYATVGGPGGTPGKISSEIIFISITLFSMLSKPLGMISQAISRTIAFKVASRRIEKFLLLEEIDTSIVQRYSRQPPSPDATVKP